MVNDIFSNDIFNSKIKPPTSKTYNLIGTHLPTNQDLFFVSKWHEIFDRYCSARLFIREAYKDKWSDWEHWFNLSGDENDEAFKIILMAEMYETALEPVHIKRASKIIANMITERKTISSLS